MMKNGLQLYQSPGLIQFLGYWEREAHGNL